MKRTGRAAILPLGIALALASAAAAEQPTLKDLLAPQAAASTPTAGGPSVPTKPPGVDDRSTPRATVTGFLAAAEANEWGRAAHYLDLSKLPRADGAAVARQLKTVLDRELWIEPSTLSGDAAGYLADDLPPDRDLLGWIDVRGQPRQILLARGAENGTQIWRFAPETVAHIPALSDALGYGHANPILSLPVLQYELLDVQLWQWIGLLGLAIAAYLVAWALAALLRRVLAPLARHGQGRAGRCLEAVTGPLRLFVVVALFSAGTFWLGLAVPVRTVVAALEQLLVVVAVTWVVLRGVDVLSESVRRRMLQRGQTSGVVLVSPGRRTLKAAILLVALIALLDGFGFKVTALIAGLGVGGIAVALAAQKSIENLFGGVTLYIDQPVRVGDFCRFGGALGTVEDIGLRSTRIRTLNRTLISIPNGDFATLQLENFSRREQTWFHPTVALPRSLSAAQARRVLAALRELLGRHALVDSASVQVHLARFTDSAFEVDVSAYVKTADHIRYLDVAEELNLGILEILEDAARRPASTNGAGTTVSPKDDVSAAGRDTAPAGRLTPSDDHPGSG
jgi:MscS family membrane protein